MPCLPVQPSRNASAKLSIFIADMHRGNPKTFLLVILLICLVLKAMMSFRYFNISADKILQVAAAKEMTLGQAYNIPVVEGSATGLQPLILWPPGYSAMLSPLILITQNIPLSTMILDLANGMAFIILLYFILGVIGFPPWVTALILLFQATQIHAAITDSASSDLIALNLWLLAIICLTSFLRSGKTSALLAFIIFNSIQPWIRYVNIPVVLALPLALICLGIWTKDPKKRNPGLVATLTAIISIAILLFFNYTRSGHMFFALPAEKGFFPSNLIHLPPVTLMSMLNIDFLLTQLSLRLHIEYAMLYKAARILNFILLAIGCIYLISFLRKKVRTPRASSPASWMLIASALVSVASIASLSLLSVTRGLQFNINEFWTYIEEQRYMLPVTFTIMLFLLYRFLSNHKRGNGRSAKIFSTLLVAIMISETAHGIWIIAKGPYPAINETSYINNLPLTKDLVNKLNKNGSLILADEDYDLRGYGILQGIAVYNDPRDINSSNAQRVLLRIRTGHEPLFPAFFEQAGIEDLGNIEGYQFYLSTPAMHE